MPKKKKERKYEGEYDRKFDFEKGKMQKKSPLKKNYDDISGTDMIPWMLHDQEQLKGMKKSAKSFDDKQKKLAKKEALKKIKKRK